MSQLPDASACRIENYSPITSRMNGAWSILHLASHTGSHIDAPLHKLATAPASKICRSKLCRPAFIADLRHLEPMHQSMRCIAELLEW
jgi:kynurenine formamidase